MSLVVKVCRYASLVVPTLHLLVSAGGSATSNGNGNGNATINGGRSGATGWAALKVFTVDGRKVIDDGGRSFEFASDSAALEGDEIFVAPCST